MEAMVSMPWKQCVVLDGETVCPGRCGASAPSDLLFEAFGIAADHVPQPLRQHVNKARGRDRAGKGVGTGSV